MSLRFRVRGVRVVRTRLNRAVVALGRGFDRETGGEMLTHLQRSMPNYPPELPGQTYVRTMNLERALGSDRGGHPMSLSEVRAIGGQQTVILGLKGGTSTQYGPEVVGFREQQREVHRGRWFTLLEHVRKQMGSLVDIVERGTRRILRRIF
jgi:hypothetical protein